MISFTWPQEEPARNFRILTQVENLEVMVEMWGEKVTPRILGALSRRMMELSTEIWGWSLEWWLSGVKRVTEDLVGARERPWEEDQLVMEERWFFRMWRSLLCDIQSKALEKSMATAVVRGWGGGGFG